MKLLTYLETHHKMNIKLSNADPNSIKQIFDLSNPELLDQLEVELTLLGINQDCAYGMFEFMRDQKHLGALFTSSSDHTMCWTDKDYSVRDLLYSIEEVVNVIRKNILKI